MCILCNWFKKLCGPNCKCQCHPAKTVEADKSSVSNAPSDQSNQAPTDSQIK